MAGDLLAIVLPSTAIALWHGRRPVLATAAWTTWMVAAALAWMGSLGFNELHISDTAARRQAIVATSVAAADQRSASITAAQLAATAAAKAREAECVKRGPLCRDREADERAALTALNAAIAAPVPTVATIADADPQVTAALRLATWVGLKVTAEDVVNLRLALMAMMPNSLHEQPVRGRVRSCLRGNPGQGPAPMGVVGAIHSEPAGIDRREQAQAPEMGADATPFRLCVIVKKLRRRRALLCSRRLRFPPVELLMARVAAQ